MLKIYSVHYHKPEFITWQHETFKKFLSPQYELIIINNARDNLNRGALNFKCEQLGLRVINTYSDTPFSLAGKHHADSLNYVWQSEIKNQTDLCMVCDGDIFLLDYFNTEIFLNGNIVSGVKQNRGGYGYISPTLVFINLQKLPNKQELDWEGCCVNQTYLDTGGGWFDYFEKNPEIKKKFKPIPCTWHIKAENENLFILPKSLLHSYKNGFDVEFYNDVFLHFCRSSGWNPQDITIFEDKINWVETFVNKRLNEEIQVNKTGFNMINDKYFGWKL